MASSVAGMSEQLPSLTPEVKDLSKTINQFITDFIKKDTSELPEHTCWSGQSRCIITGTKCQSSADAHEWLGNKIHDLRSTQGQNHFEWADEDCEKMKEFAKNGVEPIKPPLRTAFGLPHNYFFKDETPQKVDINYIDTNGNKGRRASPLFFHIYERSGKACVITTFLPAQFLPKGKKVNIKAGRNSVNLALPDNFHEFSAITDMLGKFNTTDYQGMEVIL